MPRTSKESRAIRRPYCLHCYAPLEETREAVTACAQCGHRNVRADRRIFWTQEPKLRETEWLAKVLVLGILALISWFFLTSLGELRLGTGQGWAIGFPILVGTILWETASKITRHKVYLNAKLLWGVLPMVVGVPVLLGALFSRGVTNEGRLWGLAVAAGFLGFGWLLYRAAVRFEEWKLHRIRSGQRAFLDPDSAPPRR